MTWKKRGALLFFGNSSKADTKRRWGWRLGWRWGRKWGADGVGMVMFFTLLHISLGYSLKYIMFFICRYVHMTPSYSAEVLEDGCSPLEHISSNCHASQGAQRIFILIHQSLSIIYFHIKLLSLFIQRENRIMWAVTPHKTSETDSSAKHPRQKMQLQKVCNAHTQMKAGMASAWMLGEGQKSRAGFTANHFLTPSLKLGITRRRPPSYSQIPLGLEMVKHLHLQYVKSPPEKTQGYLDKQKNSEK